MSIWEKYDAVVTKNGPVDGKKLGQIFVKSHELMGDMTTEYPHPVDPVFDWSWFYIPDIGEEIEIEVLVSDDQMEDAKHGEFTASQQVRWRNKRWGSEEGDQPRPPDPLFTDKNYGKRRGMATPKGHILMFDDTDGDEQVLMAWKNKVGKYTQMTMDKEGSILLLDHASNMVHLNAKSGQKGITVLDANTNMLALNSNGVVMNDKFGNFLVLKDGVIQFAASSGALDVTASTQITLTAGDSIIDAKADGEVAVQCKKAFIKATDEYEIGDGADTELMRFKEWDVWAKAHTHPTAFGPSGAPIVPPTPDIKSTIGKLKCSVWSVLLTIAFVFWWLR